MGTTGRISAVILALIFLLSLASPLILPYPPDEIDLDSLKEPPSLRHPLGTDNKGRDILSRVLAGGRTSISVAVLAALLSMTIGLFAGLLAGYIGGWIDTVLTALIDLVLSFPSLLLAIGVSLIFPPGIYTVMLALAAVGWASFARLIRGRALMLREEPFIEAARAVGCGGARVLIVHLLPQCLELGLVAAGMRLGGYVLTEAALSFLGLGAQPPTATWGSMISSQRAYIGSAPWMVIAPGFMIALTALCFNLLGDDIRDAQDVMKERQL